MGLVPVEKPRSGPPAPRAFTASWDFMHEHLYLRRPRFASAISSFQQPN